jgi:hypothetical protein
MATSIVHAVQGGDRFWDVVVPGGAAALPTRFPTTAALVAGGEAEWRAAFASAPPDAIAARARAVEGLCEGPRKRPAYLHPGDCMTLTIRSADGSHDLGEQQTIVRAA